jgi:predicted nucleic acid-binding protein
VTSSAKRTFVDANILIYAYDHNEGEKQKIAKRLLAELWRQQAGMLSTQVLVEFYHAATRKLKMPRVVARKVVAVYRQWCFAGMSPEFLVSASVLEEQHELSWWDALIIQAALQSGASTLLSEDMQHGQRFGELTVRNPFAPSN